MIVNEKNFDQPDLPEMMFTSVDDIPGLEAKAVFTVDSAQVFREDREIAPLVIDSGLSVMPWGANNRMPHDIISKVEDDETLATCQVFNAEVCYGAGLKYEVVDGDPLMQEIVDDFFMDNDMPSYFLGLCTDMKYFGIGFSVIILNQDASRIVSVERKEACYCRFTPAAGNGVPEHVVYANWRMPGIGRDDMEILPLLHPAHPYRDLQSRMAAGDSARKFAVVTRIPTVDSTYYPIPYYGSLFKGKWYDIKRLIALAKEAKLRNSAPIKYHIEVAKDYWTRLCAREGITDRVRIMARIVKEKQKMLDFLTRAENSGKVWFSTYYVSPDGHTQHDVVINRIETSKEGGDWETDIQEAINMVCFTMRVHSNLVGSVPGKAQSNNSGSDKRELYTIAQATQKPYRDLLFKVHRLIIRFNGWRGVRPVCPFIQLTTLDQHTDAREVSQQP